MAIEPGATAALPTEVRRLPKKVLSDLHVVEPLLFTWNAVVVFASVMIDDADERPWEVRLEETFTALFGPLSDLTDSEWGAEFQASLEYLQDFKVDDLPSWLRNIRHKDKQLFLRRLLGGATFDRLERAFRHDCAILGVALRRLVRAWMPYSVALDDLASTLSPGQLEKVAPFDGVGGQMLSVVLDLDKKLGGVLAESFPVERIPLRLDDGGPLRVDDVVVLAESLRDASSTKTRAAIDELNAQFGRKMRGARTALDVSEDAASQAALSLIELLDRLLKAAFPDDEVLAWLDRYLAGRSDLIRAKKGAREPTVRGRALCFVHLGEPVEGINAMHEFMALAIVEVRQQLQDVKHNDAGTPEELALVRKFLASVEGFLSLTLRFAWATAPSDRLELVRDRIARPGVRAG